jgi:hypothetical protein
MFKIFFKCLAWFTLLVIPFAMADEIIRQDNLRLGRPDNSTNKQIIFERTANKPAIRWNETDDVLEFSNNGTDFDAFGTGTGGGAGINLLQDFNPGFEDGTNNWTASGGTFTQTQVAAEVGFGTGSGKWDASVTSQTLDSDLQTIPNILEAGSCLVEINYKWEGSAGDLQLKVVDDSANILAEQDIPVSDIWRNLFLIFSCPNENPNAQIKIRIESTADAAVIFLDQMFLGSNTREVLVGDQRMRIPLDLQTASSSAQIDFINGIDDIYDAYLIQLVNVRPATNGAILYLRVSEDGGSTFKSGASDYSYTGRVLLTTGGGIDERSNAAAQIRMVEGGLGNTSTKSLNGRIFFYAPSDTTKHKNFQFYFSYAETGTAHKHIRGGALYKSTTNAINGIRLFMSSGNIAEGEFRLYGLRKDSKPSESALNLNQTDWLIHANMYGATGASPTLTTGAVSTYTEITDANLAIEIQQGSRPVEIACINGTASEGLTCNTAAVNESMGIAFEIPYTGIYKICAHLSCFANNANSEGVFQLIETSNVSSSIVQEGRDKKSVQSNNAATPVKVCGIFQFNSIGKKTVRLMFEKPATTAGLTLIADRSAVAGQRDIVWTAYPITSGVTQGIINNSVINSEIAGIRTESAEIDNNGSTCPILIETGDWIQSTARLGSGICRLTFKSGIFAQQPICVVTVSGTSQDRWATIQTTSSTLIEWIIRNSAAGTFDEQAMVICQGVK